jgi:hypothetical protein
MQNLYSKLSNQEDANIKITSLGDSEKSIENLPSFGRIYGETLNALVNEGKLDRTQLVAAMYEGIINSAYEIYTAMARNGFKKNVDRHGGVAVIDDEFIEIKNVMAYAIAQGAFMRKEMNNLTFFHSTNKPIEKFVNYYGDKDLPEMFTQYVLSSKSSETLNAEMAARPKLNESDISFCGGYHCSNY